MAYCVLGVLTCLVCFTCSRAWRVLRARVLYELGVLVVLPKNCVLGVLQKMALNLLKIVKKCC